jgi:hypothetical protein
VIGLYRLKGAKAQPQPALSARVSAWRRAVNQWVDAV